HRSARMSEVVGLTLPIFGVMALGWTATRTGLLPAAALDALSAFAFRFALPALVFRLVGGRPLSSLDPAFCGGYLLAGSVVFALVFAVARFLRRAPVAAAGARSTAASVGNLGFLGPPLVVAFFGERGAGPLAMAILAEITVVLSVGAVLMSTARSERAGTAALLVRGTVQNPVVVAILLGGAFAATGAALPAPADDFLGFLGAAAGPTALFALGGALAAQRIGRGTVAVAAGVAAAKLVAHPALAWWVLGPLLRLEPFWVQSGVLLAALPTAGNVYLVAQHYRADAHQVSAAALVSTVASIATVPLAAAWALPGRARGRTGSAPARRSARGGADAGARLQPPARVERAGDLGEPLEGVGPVGPAGGVDVVRRAEVGPDPAGVPRGERREDPLRVRAGGRVGRHADDQDAVAGVAVVERARVLPHPRVRPAELADLDQHLRGAGPGPGEREQLCRGLGREVGEQRRRVDDGHRVDRVGVHRVDRRVRLDRRVVE